MDKYNSKLVYVMIATKCDLDERRVVTYDEGKKLAAQWGMPFFETSSKTGQSVEDALTQFTDCLVEKNAYSKVKKTSSKRGFISLLFQNFLVKSSHE